MKEVSNYDKAIKELFQHDRPSLLLDLVTGGVPVRQTLNVELAPGHRAPGRSGFPARR